MAFGECYFQALVLEAGPSGTESQECTGQQDAAAVFPRLHQELVAMQAEGDILLGGEGQRQAQDIAPIFLAEVLSPSTEDLDFTDKLQEYKGIASVQTYLICSQDGPRVRVWQRGAEWPEPVELLGRDGTIALHALGVDISMANIFLNIPDPPAAG